MRLRSYAALLLAVALGPAPNLLAQKGGGGHSTGASGGAAPPSVSPLGNPRPGDLHQGYNPSTEWKRQYFKNEQPECFTWPMSPIVSSTVSVARLRVPDEANKEFDKACGAVNKKHLTAAQQHLERALELYPNFAAAWALLGQVQTSQGELDQAGQSCVQARAVDPSYLAGYLCLAALAVQREKWAEVAELTNDAIALHPVRAPGVYYYNARAYFYEKQEAAAEKSALEAVEQGRREQQPQVHWLLAQIYESKGDRSSEADHLREYLKLAPHAANAAIARQIVRAIERQIASSTLKLPDRGD